jgi:hypothetical protein
VLNSCIEVSDYNEPYSLCQPLLPSPMSTLGLTRAKPFGIPTPLHHGVELDRYISEGGLDVVREEIELIIGEQLPFAPRWIKGNTLAERFNSSSIKRSTLVLTVKSKKATDMIIAKGLTFSSRRHEVERF